MDGVSAFVSGLHRAIFGLASAFIGITLMSVSVTLYFSYKPIKRSVTILAVIATVFLLPAVYILSKGGGIVVGIIALAVTALAIIYDITVIRKYLRQKKKL